MTRKNFHALLAIVVALVLMIFVFENTDDSAPALHGQVLLPGFSVQANDAQRISIRRADADALTAQKVADKWVIADRDNYPADVGKLRALIIALADAKIVEEKTSNPEHYEKLGVADPEDGGGGTKVSVEGNGFGHSVIFGERAQRDYRYARLAGEPASYLVDKNPSIAEKAGDWLFPEITDIEPKRIRKVSITHEDGETITIEKSGEDQTDFTVLDIPDGRELSYQSVGNGIAGTLGKLTLDDVRKAGDGVPVATTSFETWDGSRVTATVNTENDESWVTFVAETVNEDSEDPDTDLNDRLSGWQFRIPEQKKNLLTRRWDDILKSAGE